MELILLDSTFKDFDIVDVFKSFIWTDKYSEGGDFEISLSPNSNKWSAIRAAAYFRLVESEHLMIPETFNLRSDNENGDEYIIKGRSLEPSILERRIVWTPTILAINFQGSIELLLDANMMNSSIIQRNIDNFKFVASTDPAITTLTVGNQLMGQDLYTVISQLCLERGVGFKVTLNDKDFVFELYAGVDRSYNQLINPYIVFSPEFDNLINSDYVETNKFIKTVALVLGEQGVGNFRTAVPVDAPSGGGSGLTRREIFVDANGIGRSLPGGGQLSEPQYLALLTSKGQEVLSQNVYLEAFDGEVSFDTYMYGRDFFMGDVVQVADKYGHSSRSRITEVTYSQDESGSKVFPKFTLV